MQEIKTYIALLRGINVGGHHRLPMRELVQLIEGMGLKSVKTYIQSGNAVFQSVRTDRLALAAELSAAIGESHGFTPQIFMLDLEGLQAAMNANPFPEADGEPKTLHLFFLNGIPEAPNFGVLESARGDNERYELIEDVFYLYTPDGIGRSKLAEKVDKGWNVSVTARNWRTVNKIMALATAIAA